MMNIVRKMCLPAVVSLLAVSCTSKIDADGGNTGVITFQQIHAETKAIVNGNELPAGSESFVVWGWHGNPDGTNAVNDFDGVRVEKKDSKWTYGDDLRFWELGKTYDFYAVYPSEISGTTMNVDNSGNISITSFDCSKTGNDIVDLMTASHKDIIYNEGQDPQPVSLTFSHELTRLKFIAKSEGSEVIINSISLVGAGVNGNLNMSVGIDPHVRNWTVNGTSGESGPFAKTDVSLNQDGTEVDVYGDMLVLPLQNLEAVTLKVKYTYAGETVPVQHELKLSEATAKNWSAGQSYRYTITVPVQSSDLKLEVSVLPWGKVDDAYVEW